MGDNHGVGVGQFSAIVREMHPAREGCVICKLSGSQVNTFPSAVKADVVQIKITDSYVRLKFPFVFSKVSHSRLCELPEQTEKQ